MSHISKNTGSVPGTGHLPGQRATGPINLEALAAIVGVGQDNVALGSGAATPFVFPPAFQRLSARDQAALKALPEQVLRDISKDLSANARTATLQLSKRLLAKASKTVGGEGVVFEPVELFRISDAAIAFRVLDALTPSDRALVQGVTFRRVSVSRFDEAHFNRQTDGAAVVEVEAGRGVLGRTGYRAAEVLEKFALTAPLGLMLRAWFPHALAEYRKRVIEVGDAQASRMQEVLVHEIGHQIQFGAQTELGSMRDWSKLSAWKDAEGRETFGFDEAGTVRALNPGVRPGRTNNFVYENFTEDLTPQAIAKTLAEIQDPELRSEFEQTLKVKRTLREAIFEVFGVEAMGYSMVNPLEDFAESFRAFYMDPELLLRKAPDKFLYLNANSRRFAPADVARMLQSAGQDPQQIATALAQSGISQDSLERITKANGVALDVGALGEQARSGLQSKERGVELPPLREVFMRIQKGVAAQDLAFISAFTQDPSRALAGTWERLSPAEQSQFIDQQKRLEIVQKMQGGTMSFSSATEQGYRAIEIDAVRRFGRLLLEDANFRSSLKTDPVAALSPIAENLPRPLQEAMKDAQTRMSLSVFADTLDRLIAYDKVPLLGGGDLQEMFEANLERLDEATLRASIGTLRTDPKRMAEVFSGLGIVEINGIKVPPGG
ncbi:MAG: hypothetical protein VKN33_05435 [Candidatus Sericytochromatia bacterium]|nr:hypothetical protein [Candidatus Sericytochromatia bacterium]